MIKLVRYLLVLGLTLVLGPTLIKWLLMGAASVVPVSGRTIGTLVVLILVIVVTMNLFKRAIRAKWKNKAVFSRMITLETIVALLEVLLIVCNSILIKARDAWLGFLDNRSAMFSILTVVGLFIITAAVGFFIGNDYRKKKRHENRRRFEEARGKHVAESETESDAEGASYLDDDTQIRFFKKPEEGFQEDQRSQGFSGSSDTVEFPDDAADNLR